MTPRPLTLDYRANRKAGTLIGMVLLALGLGAGGNLMWEYQLTAREAVGLERTITDLSRALHRSPALQTVSNPRELAEQIKRANVVIDQLSLSWDKLFDTVEAADDKDIALLGIEPDAHNGTLKVTAEASTSTAMLAYLQRLQRGTMLSDVLLQNHQIQAQDPLKPIRFTVIAGWAPLP